MVWPGLKASLPLTPAHTRRHQTSLCPFTQASSQLWPFAHAVPSAWNSLPYLLLQVSDPRDPPSITLFILFRALSSSEILIMYWLTPD